VCVRVRVVCVCMCVCVHVFIECLVYTYVSECFHCDVEILLPLVPCCKTRVNTRTV